jgi:flagellar hook-length control protein FliK
MTKTNIDYLFQVVAPSADRNSSSPRSGSGNNGFDDHLSQASSSAFDLLPTPNGLTRRNSSPPPPRMETDRDGSNSRDSRDSQPQRSDTNNTSRNDSTEANSPGDTSTVCGTDSDVAKEAGDADRNEDHSTGPEEAVAAAAGVAPPPTKNAAPNAANTGAKADHESAKAIAEKAAVDEIAKAQQVKDGNARAKAESTEAEKTLNAKAANAAQIEPAALASKSEESTAESVDEKPAAAGENKKSDRVDSSKQKLSDAANAKGTAANAEELTDAETALVAKATAEAQAKAAARSDATDSNTSKKDKSADDDSPHSAKALGPGDVAAAAVKRDATPVAANVAVNTAEAAQSGERSKDSAEGSTKPIGSKHETSIGPLGRAMRSVTGNNRGQQSSETELPHVDPARFVGRVAKAFLTANERGGTLQLRLNPPELGSLKLQLSVKDGVMSAQVETENANARRVLLEHLPMLRDRLADQNIRVDRFDVDVRQEGSGGQANPNGSNQNPNQPQPDQTESKRLASAERRAAETAAAEPVVIASRISSTGINLVV